MENYNKTKAIQLGMNPSTANGRLQKDILWNLIVKCGQDTCSKCNQKMCRNTFSIEHNTPWLHSDDPIKLFFDLENISFSHLTCNIGDARKPHQKYFSDEDRKKAKAERNRKKWQSLTKEDQQSLRKNKYLKHGV